MNADDDGVSEAVINHAMPLSKTEYLGSYPTIGVQLRRFVVPGFSCSRLGGEGQS